ncbi:hypothetical protein D3C80_1426810 [compost metagenome]
MVPGHDPGARAELQRFVLVHPGPFPVLVGDVAEAGARPVEVFVGGAEGVQQQLLRRPALEQGRECQLVPQRGLADTGLEDRLLVGGVGVGVGEGDREGADVLQGALVARLLDFGTGHGEFEVRHGGGRDGPRGAKGGGHVGGWGGRRKAGRAGRRAASGRRGSESGDRQPCPGPAYSVRPHSVTAASCPRMAALFAKPAVCGWPIRWKQDSGRDPARDRARVCVSRPWRWRFRSCW